MAHSVDTSVAHLLGVVDGVRRRWRLARVLRGVAITLAGVIAALVAGALILEAVRYAPAAVIAARVAALVVGAGLLWRFVVVPMLPRPEPSRVALYVEEHDPGFQGSLVSAVEISSARTAASPEMADFVRGAALGRARALDDGRAVDARGLRLSYAALGGAAAVLLAVLTLGPASLRYGMGALLTPWASAEEVNPFRLDIEPGDATVARGASVVITARPVGFQADGVELWTRTADSAQWTRIPMSADSGGGFSARLFDVGAATRYLVDAVGLRSRVYTLSVADLPYARRLDLEYHFPAYTGLPLQRADSAGDIVAPAGTLVRVRVTPTVPTPGGRLVIEGGDSVTLAPAPDGTLSGTIRVAKPGFYRVELEGARGDLLTASLNYAIDVLPDRPPTVSFTRPGRDQKVLAVDEVFTEARAADDYGVAKLDLVYSVNGTPEKVVPLHGASARIIREIAAGHTFMLEEFGLVPGDLVSYYARATDNDAVAGPKSTTSDIYFLQVRPYAQEFSQEQGGGGGGGGGGQDNEGPQQLSRAQREVIAGSFNALRDSAAKDRKTYDEDVATLRLAQQKVKNDVEELSRQLVQRGVTEMDSGFARIAEILPKAAAAMDTSEQLLARSDVRAALGPQQRALQQVQRAEAEYRKVRVAMGSQAGGGGGGGGGGAEAEDLADLFELQRDRMRNQYESVQRGDQAADERQRQDREVDAAAERLKQLAARQLQENERARRKADSLARVGAPGGSGGDAQRQLARETEETARQLERLARERQSESLAEAARRLNQASDAMRRSAGSQRGSSAAAADAAERLREARRLLDQEKDSRTQRAVQEATESARRLAEQQQRVSEDVARQGSASPDERESLQRAIENRKGDMADSARAFARRLDRAAADARREFPAVSRELQEAADTLRGRRIEDKIRQTQEWVRRSPLQYQTANERVIASDIEKLNRTVEEAQGALRAGRSADTTSRNAEALERARDLTRAAESLAERAQQARERSTAESGQPRADGGQPRAESGQRTAEGGQPGAEGGQLTRELRQRLDDARALRRDLARRGVQLDELDRAISGMQGLANRASLADPRAERELREQVIEGLRAFEYTLGRAFGTADRERALVDRSGEVPPEYRKYVEEYYRALGRTRPK